MNVMDKNALESAPFGYIQLKPISKDKSNSQSSVFLSANIAFENITGFRRAQFLLLNESDFVSGLKGVGLEHLAKYYDKSASHKKVAIQEFEYFSDFTKRLYKAQPWITEGDILHCTFVEMMDEKQFARNEEHHLKEFAYDSVIEELNTANNKLNVALIETNKQKDEKNLILNSISDIVVYYDTQMNVVWANKSATRVVGKKLSETIGKPCWHTLSNKIEICEGCILHKTIETQTKASGIKERYDGKIWDILATPVFDVHGKLSGIVETIKDITKETHAAAELKKSEEKYRRLTEKTGTIIWEFDIMPNRWTYVAPQVERILGYHPDEWTDYNFWYERIHPEDREWAGKYFAELTQKGINHIFEYRFIRKDGVYVWLSDEANVEVLEGMPVRMWGSLRDITKQKIAEQAIRESEEKLSITLQSIGDGVIATDLNGLIESMNPVAENLCGWDSKIVKGKPLDEIFQIINSVTRKPIASPVKKVLKNGKLVGLANHTILISREGIERQIANCAAPIKNKDDELKGVVLVFSDVTENYALQEKIKTSDKLFNHSIDMLCIGGFDGYFKVLNPAWTRILGWTEEELLSKPWMEFVHPDDKSTTANAKSGLDNGVEVYQFENRYICKDNSIKWLSWNSFPYPEENIVFSVARDITRQKQSEIVLRGNEEKYRLLFDKSPLGILHFNNRGIVVSCNEQLTVILGLSTEIITGFNLLELTDKRFVRFVKNILIGRNVTYEGNYTSAKGNKTTPIRIVATPLKTKSGSVEGGIALIEDNMNQIQRINLEKKVAIAEESVKFKQKFLANMSHEIRTPLTGILGMVEILEQTGLTTSQSDYLTTLKYSGENLRKIINLILDFSKIEAGKIELRKESFEFRKMFLEAKSLFQSICTKPIVFETQIDTHIPEHIFADKSRILQIVNNFLSNAVKFTEKGKISISADLIKNKYGHLDIKVCVTDTGQGIPEEEQKFLFTPFTQVEQSYARPFEGTGLGLSICKDLAKLHGGEVGLESEPGKGSTFWFTFRAKKSEQSLNSLEKETQAECGKSKARRVLLAEDKIVNQKVFRLMFESLGHNITIVDNGLQFLEVYQPNLFDIIFMDIQMPEMDGLTAIEKIREKHENLPPIIGLSANAFEGDREKYMGMGMDEYLIKPVKKDDFCRILDLFFVQE